MARGRARLTALALSGVFHAVVLGWLLTEQRRFPPPVEPPAMVVSLVSPFARPKPPEPRKPALRRMGRATPQPVASEPPPPQPLVLPPSTVPTDEADRVRRTLQALAGCEQVATAEARRRCEERREARMARDRTLPAPKLVLDMRGDFATGRNPEPYLTRKPKNGCKPRAAGAVGPWGKDGAVAGINCAWQF